MRLVVRHQTIYRYGNGSSRAAMLLKLLPCDNDAQRVVEWQVSVNDEPVGPFTRNGHGDMEALWIRHDQLETATIIASGVVETMDRAGVVSGLGPQPDPRIYLRETALTHPSSQIRSVADAIEAEQMLDRLHLFSAAVRDKVAYRTGATESGTTAAQAFAQGAGVCQDHAQIFIAMARHAGVPARYVSGYLLAGDEQGALHETHGWAEAWVAGLGWVGFDVSNGLCVTEHYIRISAGLDAHDAAPIRGTALAVGAITVDADVRIAHIGDHHDHAGLVELHHQQQQQ